MKLSHTRAMVRAVLAGALDGVTYTKDPVFGFEVPASVPDVPSDILSPRRTWADPGGIRRTSSQARRHVPGELCAVSSGSS